MQLESAFFPKFEQQWIFNLIFVRIPKNASTSLYEHLGAFNLIHKYRKDFLKNTKKPLYRNFFDPTHAKPNEIKEILPINTDNYFSFAVCRNPWDRFVSMFGFMHKHELWRLYGYEEKFSFEKFCSFVQEKYEQQDPNFFPTQNQVEWLDGAFKVKKIISFENLQEDFACMLKEYGIEHINPQLPHLNSSDRKEYRAYYNDKTKDLVSEIFRRDIEFFDYKY
jgi:hypothetical protein